METNLSTPKKIARDITKWIKSYADDNGIQSLVVGVSGGVDSALVSTLCSITGITTFVISMPIHQEPEQLQRARNHMDSLSASFPNVRKIEVDLSSVFTSFEKIINQSDPIPFCEIGFANSKSRIRMTTLYQIASAHDGIVVGTGNKVEDFGVGFFTKYGDGGVDISPIGDLTKTQVWAMAKELGISSEILNAVPTDGLWDDSRTDEQQMGASYPELEWVMKHRNLEGVGSGGTAGYCSVSDEGLSERELEVLAIYDKYHTANSHKFEPIPVFRL